MSFICSAKPEYQFQKKLLELKPHEFVQWRHQAISLNGKARWGTEIAFPKTQAEIKADGHYSLDDLLMDSDEVAAWADVGIELSISRVKGLASNSRKLPDVIYQISVANVGLMQVQCVEVLEDCCTDNVQQWLDKGWRILAVCPPNDARRPTYVMGHVEKEPHR